MARLWSSGFELNSTTANVEYTSNLEGTIVTSPVRSGTYSLKVAGAPATSQVIYRFASSDQTAPFYLRAYVYITTAPSAQASLMGFGDSDSRKVAIRINTDRTLRVYEEEGVSTIGSASSALSLNTWYRVELHVDTTTIATTVVQARIDGVEFVNSTTNLNNGIQRVIFGSVNAATTHEFEYDDVAINDSTGSFQNSWPGAGEIKHLKSNATGDNAAWTPTAGDNYTNVDEVTPNDATDIVSAIGTGGELDYYNIEASGLTGSDTISLVSVGVRMATLAVNASLKLGVKASSGGTIEKSANISGDAITTWFTNSLATPKNYALTLYDLPGASTTAWTSTELDTAQIGLENTSAAASQVNVSTEWLLVEYVTGGNTSTSTSTTSTTSSTSTTSTTSSTSTSTTTTSTSSSTSTTSTTSSTSTTRSTSTTSTSSSTTTTQSVTTSTSSSTTSSTSSSTTRSTSTTSTTSSTSSSTSTTQTSPNYFIAASLA